MVKPKLSKHQQKKSNKRPFIGVAVLLWKGDKLLLGQRIGSHGEQTWQFPGGHLDVGETVLECAAREVREETGLKIGYAEHAGFTDETFSAGGREYVTLYVSAAYLSGEPEVMEPNKCLRWQWFPCDQLPEPLFLPIVNFLKQVPELSILQVEQGIRADAKK